MLSVLCIVVLTALLIPSHQQVNMNVSPVFVDDLSTLLVEKGIYENTTAGTVLGRISCSDPDPGDQIVYFVEKTSSLGINNHTGEVFLRARLDREQSVNTLNPNEKPNSATFECVDVDSNGKEKSAERTKVDLVITVNDNNDNYPVFATDSAEGFTFSIDEFAQPGTVLDGVMLVTDEDSGANAKLSFFDFICSQGDPEPCKVFSLNYTEESEGVYRSTIVLQQHLNYEQRIDYRTELRAVDGAGTYKKNTASTGVRILVEDRQDTDPVFTNRNFNFNVREGVPVGSLVNFDVFAHDGDFNARRPVTMEVLDSPSGINLFRTGDSKLVDAASGLYSAPIIVRNEIDREVPEIVLGYSFVVKVTELDTDGSLTSATATATFIVSVEDEDDNAPTFASSTYSVTVLEIPQVTSIVQIPNLRIEVNDPDELSNAEYIMEIVSQTYSGAFGFTPVSIVSGQQNFYLTVNNFQYLDYDVPEYRSQVVIVRIVDMHNRVRGTRSSTATISITLADINDNSPSFERAIYESSIVENTANFTSILTVKANDEDSGANGEIEYSLESGDRTLFFYVNPKSGVISLVGQLDYETQSEYSFLAFAKDKAATPRTSQVLVRVLVTDYNDIGPDFTLPQYTAVVSENRTQFQSPVIVEAIDETDPNAVITYRIVSGNTATGSFVLDPSTGVLSLREALNFDLTPNKTGIYSLIVEASDNGNPPQTSQSRITVTVLDENDHKPVFLTTQYFKTLSEAVPPGTFVLQVSAIDADSGSNGEVSYRIGGGGQDSFVMDTDGKVSISNNPSLDADVFTTLSVQLFAIDGGSPQQSATATMVVTITDANNKYPSFVESFYSTILDEATPKGSSILQVSSTDPDSVHTLQYSILRNTITAINRAGAQVGSTYPYDFRNVFDISPTSGLITLAQNGAGLDRDYVVEMSFDVMVQDVDPTAIGQQTATTRVLLTIQGKPETALYFNLPWTEENPKYDIPVLESFPVGSEVMTLQARDPVEGGKVVTTYEEVPNTDLGDYFHIISKSDSRGVTPGVVVLNNPLDYESGELVHSVVVRAIKRPTATTNYGTRTATATIILTVQDFNDNIPEFTRSTYRFSVREGAPVNYQVGVITAFDRDSSSFGPIEFVLGGGLDRSDFRLYQPDNDGTVQLLVAKPLDFEKRSTYTIDIIAMDNMQGRGSAIRLSSKAVITIQVLDENDNVPTYSDLKRSFSVPETAPLQTRLGQILATDADYGLNGDVTYTLLQDDASSTGAAALQLFGITETSGVLVTKASLRGLSGSYYLRAVASDKGFPALSSSIPIIIKVQGAEDDDGTPKWISPVNNFVVYVTEHNRTKLDIQLKAKARTPGATITYSLIPFRMDYLNFRINQTTGDLFVVADLDWEVQATYMLVVQARDSNNTGKISRRTLTVELIDVNDHEPSFNKTKYAACPDSFEVPTVVSAMDNTPAGTIVAQAVACDPDGPGNNHIYYFLYTGNKYCDDNNSGAFQVYPNGSIESTRMLDYEEKEEYLVCVRLSSSATSAGHRRKRDFDVKQMTETNTTAYIVIKIIDINDNGPVFAVDTVTAVLETTPSEDTVVQVEAIDPDGPLNNRVSYAIRSTIFHPATGRPPFSLQGAFLINPSNGVITTNVPSYEGLAQGYFQLDIVASDLKNQLFNDTVVVIVIVHQRGQMLRVVLNRTPAQGQLMAANFINSLNNAGKPDKEFFFKSLTEHRTGSDVVETQTDVCFVIVKDRKVYDANQGIDVLDSAEFKTIMTQAGAVDRGTCHAMLSTEDTVKWRDLWWVLVVIAIFIFICIIILLVTICILYDRYKNYIDTQKTYLVPNE